MFNSNTGNHLTVYQQIISIKFDCNTGSVEFLISNSNVWIQENLQTHNWYLIELLGLTNHTI